MWNEIKGYFTEEIMIPVTPPIGDIERPLEMILDRGTTPNVNGRQFGSRDYDCNSKKDFSDVSRNSHFAQPTTGWELANNGM